MPAPIVAGGAAAAAKGAAAAGKAAKAAKIIKNVQRAREINNVRKRMRKKDDKGGPGKWIALVCALVLPPVLLVSVVINPMGAIVAGAGGAMSALGGAAAVGAQIACEEAAAPPPSETVSDIPAVAYEAYTRASTATAVGWEWLAAVGKVETDHGRHNGSQLHPHSGTATPPIFGVAVRGDTDDGVLDDDKDKDRAVGPMQFMPATWLGGARRDGDFDGVRNPQNIFDAALAAGFYLKAHGAPGDMNKALLAYNRSSVYVTKVSQWARKYAKAAEESGQGVVTTTPGQAPGRQTGPDVIRLVQANLFTGMSVGEFSADMRAIVGKAPDFITMNEVYRRTPGQITPAGYSSFRGTEDRDATEVAVAWRSDTWSLVARGSVLTAETDLKWARRYLSWVTVRDDDGRTVSVVSTHALTNPYSKPRRKVAAKYVASMNTLVTSLANYGAVIVAGDVNVHYPRDKRERHDFTPYAGFKASGLHSTFQILGTDFATGDRGGMVQWIFTRKPGPLTVLRHDAFNLNSDHHAVWADFRIGDDLSAFPAGRVTAQDGAAIEAMASAANNPDTSPEAIQDTQDILAAFEEAYVDDDHAHEDGATGEDSGDGTGERVTAERQAAAAQTEAMPGVLPETQAYTEDDAGGTRSKWRLPMTPGSFTYTARWGQVGAMWSSGRHTGLDFAASTGTPVAAAYDGKVTVRRDQDWAGRNFVVIDHGTIEGKSVSTWYAHMSKTTVATGDMVRAGQRIGSVGEAGNVTGPHLHFEVRVNGTDVDPMIWLAAAGVPDLSAVGDTGCGPTGASGVIGADGAWGGYSNGKIPLSAMCQLDFDSAYLECNAARALNALNRAYVAKFGTNVGPVGGYRSYEAQVACVKEKGSLCATPGTSNHGWGLAADLQGGGINIAGTKRHNWMLANAPAYGWILPPWARPGGSKPEPWHWQYGLTD